MADGAYTDRLPSATTCHSILARPHDTAAPLKARIIISEITGSESFIHVDCAGSRWVMLDSRRARHRAGYGDRAFRRSTRHMMALRAGWTRDRRLCRKPDRSGGVRKTSWHASISTISATPTARTRRALGLFAEGSPPRMGRWRRLCAAGPVRLRQDHAAQHHFGPAAAVRRQDPVRRQGRHQSADAGAQHRPGVPVPGDLRHDDRLRQSGVSAAQPGRSGSRDSRSPRHRDRRDDRPHRSLAKEGARADRRQQKQKISLGRGLCAMTSTRSCSTNR